MTLFTPILVLSMISLVLGILIVLADKFLADYGECKIAVSGEDEFVVRGGDLLLNNLKEHGINVPAACAGKASCGYCKVKVLSGGGQVLPTEKGFLTKDDIKNGVRLSCQVKVKNDMEVFMPDFIETVKDIVKNKLFDPSLNWRFNIFGREIAATKKKKKKAKKTTTPEYLDDVYEIIQAHDNNRASIIPILQNINNKFNYLPDYSLRCVSDELKLPMSDIFRISTFYNAFSLVPRGRNIIKVCMGTACYVKGGGKIIQTVENNFGITVGETTSDLNVTLDTVNCIGCCGQSPVMSVNDDIFGNLNTKKVLNVIDQYISDEVSDEKIEV